MSNSQNKDPYTKMKVHNTPKDGDEDPDWNTTDSISLMNKRRARWWALLAMANDTYIGKAVMNFSFAGSWLKVSRIRGMAHSEKIQLEYITSPDDPYEVIHAVQADLDVTTWPFSNAVTSDLRFLYPQYLELKKTLRI